MVWGGSAHWLSSDLGGESETRAAYCRPGVSSENKIGVNLFVTFDVSSAAHIRKLYALISFLGSVVISTYKYLAFLRLCDRSQGKIFASLQIFNFHNFPIPFCQRYPSLYRYQSKHLLFWYFHKIYSLNVKWWLPFLHWVRLLFRFVEVCFHRSTWKSIQFCMSSYPRSFRCEMGRLSPWVAGNSPWGDIR